MATMMKKSASTLLYGGEETYGDAGQTVEFITKVFDAVTAIHKQHLMTTGPGSFAAHEALGDVYSDLEDFGDNLAESVMGCRKVGLSFPGVANEFSAETRAIYEWIEENRSMAGTESHIQNIVDDILDKLARNLFKLDRLA